MVLLSGCQSTTSSSPTAADGNGTLVVRANGEDFIRQGFTDKDGWEMSFDHAYVTLANIDASQTDPPFEPEADKTYQILHQVSSQPPVTVDLAAGDEAEPIVVELPNAPAGRYNALSWTLRAQDSGEAAGRSVLLVGTATKDNQQIPFEIGLTNAVAFACGDFIGDARKGIVNKDETAELEATFHFDHMFGDGEAPADDDINTGALGFGPLAALAEGGELKTDTDALLENLSKEDYQTLQAVMPSLGHVGEGHCEATEVVQ